MANELTEKLRRLADGLRGICDGAGINDHTCSDVLDEAAAELERLRAEVERYTEAAYTHARENTALFARLSHLLQSETVRMYDEKFAATGEYLRDINELDKHVLRLEQIAQGVSDTEAAEEDDAEAAAWAAAVSENASQEETRAAERSVLYLCDREKCANCSSVCMHTTDIRHALRIDKHSFLWVDMMGGGGSCE